MTVAKKPLPQRVLTVFHHKLRGHADPLIGSCITGYRRSPWSDLKRKLPNSEIGTTHGRINSSEDVFIIRIRTLRTVAVRSLSRRTIFRHLRCLVLGPRENNLLATQINHRFVLGRASVLIYIFIYIDRYMNRSFVFITNPYRITSPNIRSISIQIPFVIKRIQYVNLIEIYIGGLQNNYFSLFFHQFNVRNYFFEILSALVEIVRFVYKHEGGSSMLNNTSYTKSKKTKTLNDR